MLGSMKAGIVLNIWHDNSTAFSIFAFLHSLGRSETINLFYLLFYH